MIILCIGRNAQPLRSGVLSLLVVSGELQLADQHLSGRTIQRSRKEKPLQGAGRCGVIALLGERAGIVKRLGGAAVQFLLRRACVRNLSPLMVKADGSEQRVTAGMTRDSLRHVL